MIGTSAHRGTSTAVINVHKVVAFGHEVVAGAARHALSVGTALCPLINALAVAQCGVHQHHPDVINPRHRIYY